MASVTIKSTYSLDVETVRELESIARRWNVSKSEALRRVIRAAASEQAPKGSAALEALDRLQEKYGVSAETATSWQEATRRERHDSATQRER